MKTIQSIIRLVVVSGLMNWLSAGCNKATDQTMSPAADCRILRSTSTTQTDGSSTTSQIVYTYDDQGNLANKTQTTEMTSSTNVSNKTTTTTAYTYDAASFLTNATNTIYQQLNFFGKQSEYRLESQKTYTYSNNRLNGYTQRDVVFDSNITTGPQQRTTVTTTSYEYDASGQLSKQTSSNGESITYQNGKALTLTSAYAFVLQDGLVVKATFPGTNSIGAPHTLVQLNQYDDQRRLVKHEEFINDSLTMYYTQEWQTGQPAESSLPAFKGHPLIKSLFGEPGVLTKYRAYSVNAQHVTNQYFEQTNTNQLNAAGLVTNTKQASQYLTNGAKQPDITTSSYTYNDCN